MKFEKENVRIAYCKILSKLEMWFVDGKEAEKQLTYIMGLRDMANAVIEAIEKLDGM